MWYESSETNMIKVNIAEDGAKGDNAYIHIKFSNDGGKTFTSNNGEDPGEWLGQYSDNIQNDSSNVADYVWTKIAGEAGYTVLLTNENISFSADQSMVANSDQTFVSEVVAYQGAIKRTDFSIGAVTASTPLSASVSGNKITVTVKKGSKFTSDSGSFDIPITLDHIVFTRTIAWSLSKDGLVGHAAIIAQLSNEYIGIHADIAGNNGDFSNAQTSMSVFEGTKDVTSDWTFTVSSATGVVGSLSGNTYKVTHLTANTGNVILTASRSGYDKLQKKLIVTKIKGGQPGRTYILSASSLVLNRSPKGVYAPTSITFSASYRDGNSTESTNYAGRFKVEETLDGTKYTVRYTSTSNETNYIYTPPNTLIKAIRCTLYAAGSTSQVLDMQSVVVLDDIDISDIDDKFDHITESMSTISSKVDAVAKKIVNMVTQTDIDTAINKYDGSTVKTIRDRVSKTEQDITGLRTTVSDVESKFDGSVHTLSEKISKVEQDATKFQTTVSETYATKDELSSTSNSMTSQYTQLANKFSWIVKSGTSSSNFEITDRFIALTSQALNIDALVTFKNAATSGSSTVINGGAIDTDSLFARSITATGTITGGTFIGSKIQSKNYVADSAGSIFDMDSGKINIGNGKFVFDGNNLVLTGNVTATAGYIGGTGGWKITSNQITGNANSKIVSGILQSTNFVDKSSGVQINLNNGIIKGNIEASTLAAKENFQCYSGSTKHTILRGHQGDGFFETYIGCDLEKYQNERAYPSITMSKRSDGLSVLYLNAKSIDIDGALNATKSFYANSIYCYNSATIDGAINTSFLELKYSTPYIDFHYGNSSADFTSRIIADGNGVLSLGYGGQWGAITVNSSSGNIHPTGNGNFSLGTPNLRFYKCYVTSGVENSSLVETKTQIKPFSHALTEIDNTDVYSYKLKDTIRKNGDDIVHTGFVIGDDYKLSPYLLADSKEGIDLYSAIGLTFAGVKELYAIIKKQQQEIEELKGGLYIEKNNDKL